MWKHWAAVLVSVHIFSNSPIYSLSVDTFRCLSFCSMKTWTAVGKTSEQLQFFEFSFHLDYITVNKFETPPVLTCRVFLWFFSLWGHTWLSPKRSRVSTYNSRWITRGKDHLCCSLYICYSHEHALCLSTLSRFFLDGGFSRTSLQVLSHHREGKHNLLPTVHCIISLGETIRERQRGEKREWESENLAEVCYWFLHHPNSEYKIQKNNPAVDWGKWNMVYFVWGENLLTKENCVGN